MCITRTRAVCLSMHNEEGACLCITRMRVVCLCVLTIMFVYHEDEGCMFVCAHFTEDGYVYVCTTKMRGTCTHTSCVIR